MQQSEILGHLVAAEAELPELLGDESAWSDQSANNRLQRGDRLWRPWKDGHRLHLFRLHPCEPIESKMHSHPWPAAFHTITGTFHMLSCFEGPAADAPTPFETVLAPDSYCVMQDRRQQHSLRPLLESGLMVMVTGKPWGRREGAQAALQQRNLNTAERSNLFVDFRKQFFRA